MRLWQELRVDEFWAERLPPSRKGAPKGRLNRLEQALLAKPWQQARPRVQVKLLPEDGELYVFAQSADRIAKERSMRQRQLKWLWARLTLPPKNVSLAERLNFGQGERKCQRARGRSTRFAQFPAPLHWFSGAQRRLCRLASRYW